MNIEAKMTPRLLMTASLVPACRSVADIGTDHGYLPIYLVKKGICERAVAADIKKGPLDAARLNIHMSNMGEYIKPRLSDGLENIAAEEADCVIAAGMGGELIVSILQGRKSGMERFVLQPQRSSEVVRRHLAENGFEIKKEAISREGGRMYSAFYAIYTGERYEISEKEAFCGRAELVENEPLFEEYMSYRRGILINALASLKKGSGSAERRTELERLIDIYGTEG